MKHKIILCLFVTFSSLVIAQDLNKEESIDLIANDLCEAFEKEKERFSASKSLKAREMEMGLLLLKYVNKRKKDSKELKEYLSQVGLEKVGEDVGYKLALECGELLMKVFSTEEIMEMADGVESKDEKEITDLLTSKNESDPVIQATLKSIHNDAVSYLKFSDSFDKEHIFIIKNQFEGKDLINKKNIK
eukprot:TRINITY_DN10919_c0_g1_i4.p1 TRINITY_DN10919_c0_g1~~TRINITY_DN10919_c0_g1_i4.p1  ORF type:complete len:189 (-),score=18.42 TRINITY_DN10919_c0_g1_i4:111-677(-)